MDFMDKKAVIVVVGLVKDTRGSSLKRYFS